MTDETTLLPCPFCGEDVAFACEHIETVNKQRFKVWDVSCDRCGMQTDYYTEEQGGETAAIAHWNTRYEPTCKMEPNPDYEGVNCSNCGAFIDNGILIPPDISAVYDGKYCSRCGARVITE